MNEEFTKAERLLLTLLWNGGYVVGLSLRPGYLAIVYSAKAIRYMMGER